MKKLTREQFQAQFSTRIVADDYLLGIMQLDGVRFNTPIYRALEKLVIIKDDGGYYIR